MFPPPLAYKYARAFLNTVGHDLPRSALQSLDGAVVQLRAYKDALTMLGLVHHNQQELTDAVVLSLNQIGIPVIFKNLISLLIAHKRLALLTPTLEAVSNLYKQDHGIVPCTVTTAHELTLEQRTMLEQFIAQHMVQQSQHAEISYTIDTKLIAGIKITTDTLLWEHSIAKLMRSVQSLGASTNRGY